jgi:hypothetical protein
MSFFGLKSQILLKNCEWGIVYFKLKGRSLAMSVIDDWTVELLVNSDNLDVVMLNYTCLIWQVTLYL